MAEQQYMLPLEAAAVEANIVGAVAFNQTQLRSEAEKAQARENIGASPFGMGIKIISHYDTLAELEAAVTTPKAGDAYSVGAEIPYSLYVFDFYNEVWRDYGPIRSNDISARFAQNLVVPTTAWIQDTDVFADFVYKAACPLAELTGNDFPIIGFAPSEASGGNFCPICYAFDGYVEIWARTIPTGDISIPTITFIVQDTSGVASGNNTKGITNASAGITAGSITENLLAPGAVTRVKLANDAIYSPVLGAPANLTSAYIGKTMRTGWNSSATITIPSANAANIPDGAEFAFLNWGISSTVTIEVLDTQVIYVSGEASTTKKIKITQPYGMIALKKITSGNGGSWLATGTLEVDS